MGWTNLTGVEVSATGTVVDRPCRVRAIWAMNSVAAGSQIVFRDSSAGADPAFKLDLPPAAGVWQLPLPDAGVWFRTKLHLTLPASTYITVFYD